MKPCSQLWIMSAQALVVLEEPINAACRKQIAELASFRRSPTVFAKSRLMQAA